MFHLTLRSSELVRLILASLAALLIPATAQAMTVSPTQVELVSTGSKSYAQVTVVNPGQAPMPVEAAIQAMELDQFGRPRMSKAGDDFLIMPPQALIPPGATQVFRVRWLGDPVIPASRSYMLYMNQIPVKLPRGRNAVQVVMSLGVMINVAPPRGQASLEMVDTGIANDRNGNRVPTITVANSGQVHGLLPNTVVHLRSGNWSKTLTPQFLSEKVGIGLIQPRRLRRFVLPVALPSGVARVTASLEPVVRR